MIQFFLDRLIVLREIQVNLYSFASIQIFALLEKNFFKYGVEISFV